MAVSPCASLRFASFFFALALLCTLASSARAQGWGTLEGRVTSAQTEAPVAGAAILVAGTDFGTATDSDGHYDLRIPAGQYVIRFTALGYAAHTDSVDIQRGETTRLDVALEETVLEMREVTVEETSAPKDVGVYEIDPEHVRDMPSPINDGLRALKAMPGVATNNELSNQYSVHGGGFNENLIFINGFQIFLPFRPRQGEQEGLSLVNPDLAQSVTFYTGGFPARYGGKLSSALDVRYLRPESQPLSGSAYLSTMDAGLTASSSALDSRLGWAASVRKARSGRLFGTQELKGRYQPDYTDAQALLSYRLAPGHEVEALGMWADYEYRFKPSNRRTYFGILSLHPEIPSNLQSQYTTYSGQEQDGYETRFGGFKLKSRLSQRLRVEHDLAYYQTVETEQLDIKGTSELTLTNEEGETIAFIAESKQSDFADNRVSVRTITGRERWLYTTDRHAAEAGWHVRRLHFDDRIREKTEVDTPDPEIGRAVVNSMFDSTSLGEWQAGAYAQDAISLLGGQPDRLVATVGLRTDYFSFNDEWTVSPRLSARYLLTEHTTLMGSAGLYHQAPTYREMRGQIQPIDSTDIEGALNRDLEAQRSLQFVLGGEHFLPERRLYLRAEAYYKHLTNLISYRIENVRVQYSGENDSRGYAYGLDLQLRGEFVPGLESWVNYSYLRTEERFLPEHRTPYNTWGDGWIPRPTDQRHTISVFVQDYIPNNPTWKIHLRALYGSGLPYTPPEPDEYNDIDIQKPGDRMSQRYLRYARFDMGVGKRLTLSEDVVGRELRFKLTGEVLNVFDMTNTVGYQWTRNYDRIPIRLTPRTVNVRLRVEF